MRFCLPLEEVSLFRFWRIEELFSVFFDLSSDNTVFLCTREKIEGDDDEVKRLSSYTRRRSLEMRDKKGIKRIKGESQSERKRGTYNEIAEMKLRKEETLDSVCGDDDGDLEIETE